MSPNSIAIKLPETEGGYGVLEADPPWHFQDYVDFDPEGEGSRAVERHYSTMSLDEIMAMREEIHRVMAPDSHLFLWGTWPMIQQAFQCMDAWGYRYSGSGIIWLKLRKAINVEQLCQIKHIEDELHLGLGHTTRKNTEFMLLGRRGSPRRIDKGVREVLVAPRRAHSQKPDEAYKRIEKYCAGPRISLFSRTKREGWDVWGNETDKFAGEPE